MPKPKPDNIVRHEIVLGRSEREIVDSMAMAYNANRVLSPVLGMLGSTTGLLLVSTLLLAYLERFLPEDWQDRSEDQLRDWFEAENLTLAGIGFGLGAILGIPGGFVGSGIGGTVGAFAGSATQEIAEEAQVAGVPKLMSYGTFGQIVGLARVTKGVINDLQGSE